MKIIDCFTNMVKKYPNKIAAKDSNLSYTYLELYSRMIEIEKSLSTFGVIETDIVAIYYNQCIEYLAIMLAIIKSGAAFLPIDIGTPKERREYILKKSKAKYLVIQDAHGNIQIQRLVVDGAETSEEMKMKLRKLAYVIFTSGTTGRPKGVMIHQQGLINHLEEKIRLLSLSCNAVLAQTASIGFDISIWQYIAPIMVGGTVVVYSNIEIRHILKFVKSISEQNINILELVPSYTSILVDVLHKEKSTSQLNAVKYFVSTGEPLTYDLAVKIESVFHNAQIVNAYGPTEASDDVTHFIFDKKNTSGNVPIGTPIKNMNLRIVDEHGNECNVGERGEIWLEGVGVGLGYIYDEKLSKEVFIGNGKIYRTGDIGSFDESNNYYYWGRVDNQVKINGNRIELSEIEGVLAQVEGIINICVLVNNSKLIAFYCADKRIHENSFRTLALKYLPNYMIPNHYIYVKRWPITVNNKTNKKELYKIMIDKKAYASSIIKKMIQQYTTVEGDETSFLEMGFDSLSYIKLIVDLETEFGIEIKDELLDVNVDISKLTDYIVTQL